MSPSRRDFVKCLPGLAFGSALSGKSQKSQRQPDVHFPVKARDRLAVTSWPFRAYIESPTSHATNGQTNLRIDLKEFPALIAKRFNIYNINPLSAHFRSTDPAYLGAFRQAVEDARSHVVDLGLSGGYFYDADVVKRNAAVDFGRKWIDIAVVIGSPSVRQHIEGRRDRKPDLALAAESLGRLADYGSRRNIIVNLENDNPVSEDPFFLINVIEKVNSPYLRALPDFGNSLAGHDPEYNAKAVTAMFKHAYSMCHVKDAVYHEGKTYTVDLERMFGIAEASSYRGYFSMEFDIDTGDPFRGTEKLIQATLKYLR